MEYKNAIAALFLLVSTVSLADSMCPEHLTTCDQSPVGLGAQIKLNSTSNLEQSIVPALANVEEDHGQLNFAVDCGRNFVTLCGQVYGLKQFHLHSPEEHVLASSKREKYPLEMHLVYQLGKAKETAAKTAAPLVVIGVFIKEGKANPAFDELAKLLQAHNDGSAEFDEQQKIDLPLLKPKSEKGYSYSGSLTGGTKEPYMRGVRWRVLTEPIEISKAQIERLRKLKALHPARAKQAC